MFRSGHLQTVVGAYLPYRRPMYRARHHFVRLADGDQLVLHDDCPKDWQPHDRSALLIHGLAGCHESGYMERIAHKLCNQGVRAFRMDLRGCGAGVHLARLPYHSGRSEDAAAALEAIAEHLPHSPTTLIGFSLGANITLKLLGELGHNRCGNLDSAVAVCPPVDLAACSEKISQPKSRVYDRYFVRLLLRQLEHRRKMLPELISAPFTRRPRTLWEFDDSFTAAVWGFRSADPYSSSASSAAWIAPIRVPTLVLASRDDPMIPADCLENAAAPESVQIHMTDGGGHLGFLGRSGVDPDRRWMEWRVVDWVMRQAASAADRVSRGDDRLVGTEP